MSEVTEEAAEEAALNKKIDSLRRVNMQMLSNMKQAGAEIDLGNARVEMLMEWLVEAGLITQLQLLEEQVRWETHLRSQLQPIYQRFKEAVRMSGAPMQSQGGLIIPGVNAPKNIRG